VVEQLKPDDLAWVSRPYRWVTFARKVLGRPDAVAVLRRREEVREELRQHLHLPGPAEPPRPPDEAVPEVLVVKLRPRKRWAYPRTDERMLQMTASSWFKYEVKDVGDAFLEVFAAAVNVEIRKGKARRVDHEGRFVYLVGRIPLESIHHIDWSPDPTNWLPRSDRAPGSAAGPPPPHPRCRCQRPPQPPLAGQAAAPIPLFRARRSRSFRLQPSRSRKHRRGAACASFQVLTITHGNGRSARNGTVARSNFSKGSR